MGPVPDTEAKAASNLICHRVQLAAPPCQPVVRFAVARERFRLQIEVDLAVDPVGDVRQVALRGRQVALLNFAIQILALARADSVDEVLKGADLGLVDVRDLRARVVGDVGEAEVVCPVRNPR